MTLKHHHISPILIVAAVCCSTPGRSATLYWDSNGTGTAGSGATPTGTWGTDAFWTTDSTGADVGSPTLTAATTSVDDLFFSAGTDAVNAYTISLNGATQNARLVTFEDGTVTLNNGTLSLGNGGGITVSSSAVTGATISSNLTISGSQSFNVAAGEVLTLDTGTFTRNAGSTLNISNTGTITTTMTGLSAGSLVNGIIGPWASYGSGASTRYATIDGSNNIVAYTGGTAAATAANVTSTLGTLNYDVAAVGTLGAGANINTLRYTGAAGTIAGALTTNGIMNVSGNALTFSGTVTGAGGLVVNTANGNITFGSALTSGTSSLIKDGSGRLTLTNAATTFTGSVTVNGGVLQYGDTISQLTSGNITLNGGVIEQRWTESITKTQGGGAGQIQILGGESGFSENGNTGLTWNIGAVTWGSATFNPSKFVLQTSASQGTSSLTFSSAINLNGATRTVVANAGVSGTASSTLSGIISNSTGTAGLIKEGSGLLNLSVANTYNGGTTVSAGTLSASTASSRLGSNVVGNDISVSAGARLLLTNSANVGNNQTITLNNTGSSLSVLGLGYVGLPSASVTFGSGTGVLAINTTGYNTNLTSTLSGNSIFLGSTSTGTFSGGAATIAAGSGSLYRLGGGGGTLTISTANAITGANAVQIGSTATNGTGTIVFGASQDFTLGVTVNSGSALTLGASQGFSGGVAINSGGIVTINTTQAFGGGVTLASGGQIFVNPGISGAAFGTGGLTVNGGRIDIAASSGSAGGTATTTNDNTWNGSWTIGRGSTGTAVWNNNGNILLGNNITVSSANNNTFLNLGGIIDDGASSFGLTFGVNGATLSNANTYNGATAVTAGALTLANTNAIQNSSGLSMVTGTTLNLLSDSTATFATPLTTLSTTGTASMTIDVNRVSSGSGNQLTLNGGLFVSNAHGNVTTLNFTGGNSYTISIPTLRLEASSSGGTGGGLTLNPTTTSVAIGAMNMPVSNKVQLLTLGGTSSGNTMGAISNTSGQTLSLTKLGASSWSITGASNYTGTTTIQAGSLIAGTNAPVSANGAFGNASSALVLGNATTAAGDAPAVLINGAFTVARAITVGSLANTNAYNATIGGSNTSGTSTYSGNITLNTTAANYTFTMQAAAGGITNFTTGTWTTNNKVINVGSSGNTGIVRLSNTMSTTGAVNVNHGTFQVNGTLGGVGSTVSVASGATLGGTGTINSSVTINAGGTLAAGNSIESLASGNLTLAAAAIFAYEMDNNAAAGVAGDLMAVTGNLSIANAATLLTLSELGAGSWTAGDKLTLIAYSGTWNNGLFSYSSSTLNDGATITFSGMDWVFDYNDTSAGTNFTGDLSGMTGYVTMTAIPEPSVTLLGGLAALGLLLRRRR